MYVPAPSSRLAREIDSAYLRAAPRDVRRYIGASCIGDECDARLAFELRGFPTDDPPSPAQMRIFKLGHTIEELVIADLVSAGFDVQGEQEERADFGGHFLCHVDVRLRTYPPMTLDWDNQPEPEMEIVEIKGMGFSVWKVFKEKGLRISHPDYFQQLQAQMGLFGEKRGTLLAYNKGTSEYHDETLEFEPHVFHAQRVRVADVMANNAERYSPTPQDPKCLGCSKRTACWSPDLAAVEQVCATCSHAEATHDGGWYCQRHSKDVDEKDVCADWQIYRPLPFVKRDTTAPF